jgi:hypothetical protein
MTYANHAFGERAVLKLMNGALIRAAERWHGIRVSEFERRQLKAIRDQIDSEFAARIAPATTPIVNASPTRLSSKDRTGPTVSRTRSVKSATAGSSLPTRWTQWKPQRPP